MRTSDALNSYRRVQALAEVAHRYAAVVKGLSTAIEEVLGDLPPEAARRLDQAVKDAEAQVAAAGDALSRAMQDLPEGSES